MKPFANHCLDRMTYGARPDDLHSFELLGENDDDRLGAYLDQQLAWSGIDDSAFDALIATLDYTTLDKTLDQLWADHHVYTEVEGFDRNLPIQEMDRFVIARAIHSKRQLLETLSDSCTGPDIDRFIGRHRMVIPRINSTGSAAMVFCMFCVAWIGFVIAVIPPKTGSCPSCPLRRLRAWMTCHLIPPMTWQHSG
jgi:hypothetical protein